MKLSTTEKQRLQEASTNQMVIQSLIDYVEQRQPTGDFLQAVLSNDLSDSVSRNDGQTNLKELVKWIYNNAPSNCWGSREAYKQWIKGGKI